jgi:hypothetical protein
METTLPNRRTQDTQATYGSYIALSRYKSRFPVQVANLEVIECADATATCLPGMTILVIAMPTQVAE